MKIRFLGILLFVGLFSLAGNAQESFNGRSFSGIKNDYNSVGMVAHVKIKEIKLAASDIHPLYAVESEIVETFKGAAQKGRTFTFYFRAEEDYNVKRLVGKEWIVFLEREAPVPTGGKGWYELENSKLTPSTKLNSRLRKLKNTAKKV